jgi:hypothetical protein
VLAAFVPSVVDAADNKLLIEKGRQLFMNETFNGNGRTCASCHPPTNNFTIDPAFIARLPDSDPLFVAEFNPALAKLEDPGLMRKFGLILENLDGFENPGVMRGVPHTLGLPVSMTLDPADDNLVRADGSRPANGMGWSADGAPEDGSLRSFALGAVRQHFPKTLNRKEGVDFRLPTESELGARGFPGVARPSERDQPCGDELRQCGRTSRQGSVQRRWHQPGLLCLPQ